MAEGIRTYNGLAVPLYGESEIKQQTIAYDILTLTSAASNTSDFLVLQDSSDAELFRIEDDGRIWMSATKASGDNIACYRILSADATGQCYAATFLMDEATYSPAGYRTAVLNLRFDCSGSGAETAKSWINFEDHGTDCPTLFTFPSTTESSGGFFQASDGDVAVTHLMQIYVGSTKYYICVTDSSAT